MTGTFYIWVFWSFSTPAHRELESIHATNFAHNRPSISCSSDFVKELPGRFVMNVPRHIEMMRKASQWCRDLGRDVSYLPRREGGKLYVLRIESGFAAAESGQDEVAFGGDLRNPEERGKPLSVDSFIKGEFARFVNTKGPQVPDKKY